jgi:DNA-binding LacI/PurR family transcriptional regulator
MSSEKKTQDSTILDIAEALKLSPATISRALNNHPYVKEKTKDKVLAMAAELGYRRNLMASSLRSNKTNTIGLIVPRISMFFHAEAITAIQNHLHEHGYNLIICQSNDSVAMEKQLAGILYSSRVDAVIAASTLYTTDFNHFDQLLENGTPVIFYDRVPMSNTKATVIKGDDSRGGYLATSHLIETGCKRIAHISGPLTCNLYRDRSSGFFKAMQQYNIPVNEDWIFYQELTYENARQAMRKIFESSEVPDAIFTDNDTSAIAALEFAKEVGISVPDELKIVGYSNDPRTSIMTPSITSIEQFPGLVGKRIVEVLMDLLKDNTSDVKTQSIITPVQLIRRMST